MFKVAICTIVSMLSLNIGMKGIPVSWDIPVINTFRLLQIQNQTDSWQDYILYTIQSALVNQVSFRNAIYAALKAINFQPFLYRFSYVHYYIGSLLSINWFLQ